MNWYTLRLVSVAVLSLAAALGSSGCASDAEVLSEHETWEHFEERSTRVVDGHAIYIVEWDIEVSREELRAYYEANIAPKPYSDGLGEAEQALAVNRVYNTDDIWSSTHRQNLTYCVSNDFGSLKDRVVSEMWAAAATWEGAASVKFVYAPTHDGNCSVFNTNVIIHVLPWTSEGAHAFFPSYTMSGRVLRINYPYFDAVSGIKTTAILTHELGHVLGFRHEHTRPDSGQCFEDNAWRALTTYDSESVMHYPQCNGTSDSWWRMFALTNVDREGAASIYGPGATPNGNNAIDRSDFFVRQVYRDVLKRDPDTGGLAFFMNGLNACNGASACLASQRVAVALAILKSQENLTQDPDLNPASSGYKAAFVSHCYTNFLRREPTTAERDWWVSVFNSSGDSAVVRGFVTSPEYRKRFGTQ